MAERVGGGSFRADLALALVLVLALVIAVVLETMP